MMSVKSEALIELPEPANVLSFFINHVREEHEMEFDVLEDGGRFLEMPPMRIELRVEEHGLRVSLFGPDQESLAFLKEDLIEHVTELDEEVASKVRWSGEVTQAGDLPMNFKVLRVSSSIRFSQNLQRVTLTSEEIASLAQGGSHIRLRLPLDTNRAAVWPHMAENGVPIWPEGEDKLHARFVTIKHVRDDTIDVDIVRHQGGLVSEWAETAAPGDVVGMMGPAGVERLPKEGEVFLAADETGLPSIARLISTATREITGHAIVAATEDLDLGEYLPASRLSIERMDPDEFRSKVLERANQLTQPGSTIYGYFAGEFGNAQDMRTMFKSRLGLDKTTQLSVAYWREGMPGFGS